MDMKINSKLIIELRKSRAWTQQQLSIVSGISLRTVQRAEKEGNTSLETLKSLASTFETDVSALTLKATAPLETKYKVLNRKVAAIVFLFISIVSSLFITSTTTAASGIEISATSVVISKDRTITTFYDAVEMIIPNNTEFEVSALDNASLPHLKDEFQLVIKWAEGTFLVSDAKITKTSDEVKVRASKVRASSQLAI